MDFFEHQEVARRTSRRLIVLFALAVLCVVVAVNVVGAGVYFTAFLPAGLPWGTAALPNGFFLTNTLVVLGLIAGGTAIATSLICAFFTAFTGGSVRQPSIVTAPGASGSARQAHCTSKALIAATSSSPSVPAAVAPPSLP